MPILDAFRKLIFSRPDLQQALDSAVDDREFASLASRQAREHGLDLSEDDVLAALQRARQSWVIRTLP